MSKERARLDVANAVNELIIVALRERIVELEAYLKKVQADRVNDISIERKRWAKADLNAITDLERSLKISECMIENQKLEIANLNAALNESKWINCRASLPEYGAPVTVKTYGVVQNITYTLSGAGDDFDEKLDWFEPYHFEHDDNCKIPLSNNIEWMPLPKAEALKEPKP